MTSSQPAARPSKNRSAVLHFFQAALIIALFGIFRALPLDIASAVGGRIGTWLGPRLKRHSKVARRNLAQAFPEKSEAEREHILIKMWEHLGRNATELAHLPGNALYSRVSCKGLEHLPSLGQPVIFVSGHVGQWELTYAVAYQHGLPITLVYRHLNNPYLDRFLVYLRGSQCSGMFPKGPKGAAKMAGALKRRESLAMLVDQKMNEGIPIPFFGREAMTAPAIAQISLRFGIPILPARVVRTQGCHFIGTAYPPLDVPRTGDAQEDIRTILFAINRLLEGWIREYPEQWMWIHRRWGKEFYKVDLSGVLL